MVGAPLDKKKGKIIISSNDREHDPKQPDEEATKPDRENSH